MTIAELLRRPRPWNFKVEFRWDAFETKVYVDGEPLEDCAEVKIRGGGRTPEIILKFGEYDHDSDGKSYGWCKEVTVKSHFEGALQGRAIPYKEVLDEVGKRVESPV